MFLLIPLMHYYKVYQKGIGWWLNNFFHSFSQNELIAWTFVVMFPFLSINRQRDWLFIFNLCCHTHILIEISVTHYFSDLLFIYIGNTIELYLCSARVLNCEGESVFPSYKEHISDKPILSIINHKFSTNGKVQLARQRRALGF